MLRSLYDFFFFKFKNRKPVSRGHIVLALHDNHTDIFRRPRNDYIANARFSVNLLQKKSILKLHDIRAISAQICPDQYFNMSYIKP